MSDEKLHRIINEAIIDNSDNEGHRIDADSDSITDKMYDDIYHKYEQKGLEVTDEEAERIIEAVDSFYKDGFYIADDGYSLEDYADVVNDKLDEVSSILEDQGFEVTKSLSSFAVLVSSRYYEKNDLVVRIGDHKNGIRCESFTPERLYSMSVQDLVKFVHDSYQEKLKAYKEQEHFFDLDLDEKQKNNDLEL